MRSRSGAALALLAVFAILLPNPGAASLSPHGGENGASRSGGPI